MKYPSLLHQKNLLWKKRIALLCIAVIALNLLILLYMHFSSPANATAPTAGRSKEHVMLVKKYSLSVREKNAERAYLAFKQETDRISDNITQHIHAHLFGEALYKEVGIEGSGICDEAYTYGCYHSFFGFAIQEHGLQVLQDLRRGCEEKNRINTHNCIHGIGHSIIYSLGSNQLERALAVCADISTGMHRTHCTNGVFMEYNMNTINNPSGDSRVVRQIGKSYYEPCDAVPEGHQASCYNQLPQWWSVILKEDYSMRQIGALCTGIANPSYRDRCYYAAGAIMIGPKGTAPKDGIVTCRELGDATAALTCQKGFLESGTSQTSKHVFTTEICAELQIDERNQCLNLLQ